MYIEGKKREKTLKIIAKKLNNLIICYAKINNSLCKSRNIQNKMLLYEIFSSYLLK